MKVDKLFFKLFLLFTVIPIVELYILFNIADAITWWYTLLIVVATGVAGSLLAKREGRMVIKNIQTELSYGLMPKRELINGLCILIGGILLITPGILTDIAGFTLIIPVTRKLYIKFITRKFKKIIDVNVIDVD